MQGVVCLSGLELIASSPSATLNTLLEVVAILRPNFSLTEDFELFAMANEEAGFSTSVTLELRFCPTKSEVRSARVALRATERAEILELITMWGIHARCLENRAYSHKNKLTREELAAMFPSLMFS